MVRTRTSSIMVPAFVLPSGGDFVSGLINFWPMNDANVSGTTILDTQGTDNGTAHGGIASAAGPNGTYSTARSVDGVTNSYIVLSAASGPFNWNSGSFTVTGWIYLTNNSLTEGGNRVSFLSDDRPGDGLTNYLRVLNNTSVGNGALAVNVSDNGGSTGVAAAAGTIQNNTWLHYAYTNVGGGASGTKVLYVNGLAVATTASAAGGAGNVSCSFGNVDDGNTGTGVIGGRICAFRIYNRALAAGDVLGLFNAGG